MIIGRPLDFSRYEGMAGDRFVERSMTDEIMYRLMELSGQEYVDVYAAKVKADAGSGRDRVATDGRGPRARHGDPAAGHQGQLTPPVTVRRPPAGPVARYFYDCEFIEDGRTIELVSIGVVAQDGREFYAVSTEFDPDTGRALGAAAACSTSCRRRRTRRWRSRAADPRRPWCVPARPRAAGGAVGLVRGLRPRRAGPAVGGDAGAAPGDPAVHP